VDPLLTLVPVHRGKKLLVEGARDRQFVILTDGWIRVFRGSDSLGMLGPGDFVGEMALLDGGPRSATVSTATDTAVWVVNGRDFNDLMQIDSVAEKLCTVADARRSATTITPGLPPAERHRVAPRPTPAITAVREVYAG
jgi:CRP-like cAMP-binding protein